ncbi:outer membrane biosynthesis protein TonB [Pseudomonas monsensis]
MGNVQTAASAQELLWRQTPSGELVDLGRPHRVPLGQLRLQRAPKGILSRREKLLLGVLALLAHGAVIYWINQHPTPALPIVPPEIPPMTIEFSRPAPPAPPVVEPPPPAPVVEPPPPVEDELAVKPPPTETGSQTQAGGETRAEARAQSRRATARAATTGSTGGGACTTGSTRTGPGNAGISERRVPEEPGAGISVAGSASRLGGHCIAACACVGQRQTG